MPALRFCYRRIGRLSVCARCAGRKYSDRNSARRIEAARRATAGSEIPRRAAARLEGNWCEVHAFARCRLMLFVWEARVGTDAPRPSCEATLRPAETRGRNLPSLARPGRARAPVPHTPRPHTSVAAWRLILLTTRMVDKP